MRLRQFKYFIGIVEHGGFTRAAERLFVAQSALSLQMKKLEDELGTPLFVRNSNGVTLTLAGEAFLRHAQCVTAQVAACDREIRNMVSDAVHGVVRIGIGVSLSRVLTIPLLHAAQTQCPGISLHVIEALTTDMERGLDDGSLDVAIGFGWTGAAEPRGATDNGDVLRLESLYLVSPPNGDGSSAAPVDLAELSRYALVMPTARYATRRFLIEEAAKRGLTLPVRYELDSLPQALSMVIDGEAHSIMSISTFLPEWQAGSVRARPVSGLSRAPQLRIRTARSAASPAAAAVTQLVHATARELTDNGKWPSSLEEDLSCAH